MREVVKSVDCNCGKIEIFFPSVSKEEINLMVEFLYTGKISNLSANEIVVSEVHDDLTNLLGFPNCMQSTKGTPVVPIFTKKTKTIESVPKEVDDVPKNQLLLSQSADHSSHEKQKELDENMVLNNGKEEGTNEDLDDLSSILGMKTTFPIEKRHIVQEKAMIKFVELDPENCIKHKEKESIDMLEPLNITSHNADHTEGDSNMRDTYEEKLSVETESISTDLLNAFDLSENLANGEDLLELATKEKVLKTYSRKPKELAINPVTHKHTSAYKSKWANQNSNLCHVIRKNKIPTNFDKITLEEFLNQPKKDFTNNSVQKIIKIDEKARMVESEEKFVKIKENCEIDASNFKCASCDFSYPKRNDLIIHVKEKHKSISPLLNDYQVKENSINPNTIMQNENVPKTLQNKYRDETDLKEEERKMALAKLYRCKYCNINFVRVDGLRRHLQKICTLDPNRFESVPKMKIENATIPQFQCKKCEKSFSSEDKRNKHYSVHDKNRKKYDCSLCDKKFVTQQAVDIHISSIHEGKKPYLCPQCGYSCANKFTLKNHIRVVHEGKRLYPCDQCNNTYKSKQQVKEHISAFHEKNKPFKCSVCSCSFATNGILKKHGGVHTNIRPYSCTICEDKFKRSWHLVTHLKTIHNVAKNDWKI